MRIASLSKTWLYAGKSGVSGSTRLLATAGSKNLTSADNQQETCEALLQGDPQRLHARRYGINPSIDEDIVRTVWRHAEIGRNDQSLISGVRY